MLFFDLEVCWVGGGTGAEESSRRGGWYDSGGVVGAFGKTSHGVFTVGGGYWEGERRG